MPAAVTQTPFVVGEHLVDVGRQTARELREQPPRGVEDEQPLGVRDHEPLARRRDAPRPPLSAARVRVDGAPLALRHRRRRR